MYTYSCSELFTNCMDMLGALLQTLPFEFHTCLVSGGEDGKKSHSSCIKKMKVNVEFVVVQLQFSFMLLLFLSF